jgi:ornithine decarboxylase
VFTTTNNFSITATTTCRIEDFSSDLDSDFSLDLSSHYLPIPQMSRLDVLPAQPAVDFTFISQSVVSDPFFSRPFTDNIPSTTDSLGDTDLDDDIICPDLPAVHRGHPDVHLRKGIMKALALAVDNEPDAEKAFFVADLSQVYMQHQKWKHYLPQIEPFFGERLLYLN